MIMDDFDECHNTYIGAMCDCSSCNMCISKYYGDDCRCSECREYMNIYTKNHEHEESNKPIL